MRSKINILSLYFSSHTLPLREAAQSASTHPSHPSLYKERRSLLEHGRASLPHLEAK
ncbi:hypothetical protein [Fischerella thermalis]|uniref:hypothetical protein n=1 Tax=Fischerella thermalis TaxID=372787 RepID=UPI0015E0B2D6|nr:hypothetical protein [Fischerella thermalis]